MRPNAPLTKPGDNPFKEYSKASKAHRIHGTLLRPLKGQYATSPADTIIPIGTRAVAAMNHLQIGWVRWEDGVPSDPRMGLLAERFSPPRRNELGDTDKSQWSLKPAGTVKDPWAFTNHLPLILEGSKEVFTFVVGTVTGVTAVSNLIDAYSDTMRAGQLPVIVLASGRFRHRDPAIGWVPVPFLPIASYVDEGPYLAALETPEEQAAHVVDEVQEASRLVDEALAQRLAKPSRSSGIAASFDGDAPPPPPAYAGPNIDDDIVF
jgi:hypothetical protein